MPVETLQSALEREHREIDGGIEAFLAHPDGADATLAPLIEALAALRRHIYLEEEFLFPPLRAAGMAMPIFVMLREHGELWRAMDTLNTLIDETAEPERLRAACTALLAQLDQHNSKEEPVIYPLADTTLTGAAGVELVAFLESGQLPGGWTCQLAS